MCCNLDKVRVIILAWDVACKSESGDYRNVDDKRGSKTQLGLRTCVQTQPDDAYVVDNKNAPVVNRFQGKSILF